MKKIHKLAVIGAGGHAKVVFETARATGYEAITVHDVNQACAQLLGAKVLPAMPSEGFLSDASSSTVIAIGDNAARLKVSRELEAAKFSVLIHPNSVVAGSSAIGEGSVVFANAVIQPDSVIGKHCIINSAAVIEHDVKIADFCHIAPTAALAGGVEIASGAFIGMGAKILPGVRVGVNCVVAAGAVVTKDVADHNIVIGVPAKVKL